MFRKPQRQPVCLDASAAETNEQIITNMERLKAMLSGSGSRLAIERAIDAMAKRLERRNNNNV